MIISTYISTKFQHTRSWDPWPLDLFCACVYTYVREGIYIQDGKNVLVDSRSCKRAFTRVTYDVPQVTTLCACIEEGKGDIGIHKGVTLTIVHVPDDVYDALWRLRFNNAGQAYTQTAY